MPSSQSLAPSKFPSGDATLQRGGASTSTLESMLGATVCEPKGSFLNEGVAPPSVRKRSSVDQLAIVVEKRLAASPGED